ncbi:MAG TPA: FtsH protease activity modulator HflK [Methylotenera sp.]|nr:FtsH protease activity modulator HflK [Methylotenera sp.]HPH04507.1 FtsH protease activity modulator HflK [Methylotenera sp.]HPN01171.1 FtsH protease activity modulator HflK [Methylotenera sp.]
MIKFPGWRAQNNDGPPDLDQVFRDVSKKINELFGSGKNSQQPNRNGTSINIPLIPIVGIILLIWLASGFYKVDSGSVGVEQRFGQMADDVTEPGLHWHIPYPIEKVTVVNLEEVRKLEVGYRSSDGTSKTKQPQEALMLTEDENIIELQFAVQYNLNNAKHYLFNNRSTDDAVRSAAESAIREVVGKNKLDDLLQKGLVDTSARMQAILDRYKTGVHIISVSLQSALPPEPVQEAFEDVNRANQDNQRQINEGQAYARDVIPKSRGQASRLLAEAAGYKLKMENEAKGNASRFDQILAQYNNAPEVTRQRLYLDAQEQILSSVSKVVVDQKAGSMLYLPIDKLMNNSTAPQIQVVPQANTQAAPVTSAEVERTRDALRNRDRETR